MDADNWRLIASQESRVARDAALAAGATFEAAERESRRAFGRARGRAAEMQIPEAVKLEKEWIEKVKNRKRVAS